MKKLIPFGTDSLMDDMVVDSNDWAVRLGAAEECYALDHLVEDNNEHVRAEVAKQGYGLECLINDPESLVREAVKNFMEEQGYNNLAEWAEENPDRIFRKSTLEKMLEK